MPHASARRWLWVALRAAAVGTALLLLFPSSLLPIYDTPLSSARARSTLWQLFE